MEATVSVATSALGPFSHRPFAVIWAATSISLTGLAISDAASAWLMTTLDAHADAISFVQVASYLPMFLLTMPAAALADILPLRTYLITLESLVVMIMTSFGMAVYCHVVGPALLLTVVFLLGSLWSLAAPAWMSMTPLLVPRGDLEAANAVNSVGYNVSRVIGPAFGAAAIVYYGVQAPYWLFAVANTISVLALVWWRAPARPNDQKRELLFDAVRDGFRHVLSERRLRHTIFRTITIYPFAAAYLALLPLIAKNLSTHGAHTFGFLLALVSIGAVIGVFVLKSLRSRYSPDRTVVIGTLVLVVGLLMFAAAGTFTLAAAAAIVCGAAWTIILAILDVSAQLALPDEIRSRGLGAFLTAIFGCVALGSALWGQIAAWRGPTSAFLTAAIIALALIPIGRRWDLLGACDTP
jgi:MFS family permease